MTCDCHGGWDDIDVVSFCLPQVPGWSPVNLWLSFRHHPQKLSYST